MEYSLRKWHPLLVCLTLLSVMLSGCLYPDERRAENQMPSAFFLEATQKAIDQFRQDTSVLPIVTKDLDTPIFEKYEIDFRKLIPKYMPDVPGNSFEKGGVFKYVLIDVETNPTVRLIQLSSISTVADVQRAVHSYQYNNDNELPIKEDIGDGYFSIDFGKIGMKETQVPGTAGTYLLPLVMNGKGDVGIDYAIDIATVLRESKATVQERTDPRYVMARESNFVPAKSFPYTMVGDQPKLLKLH
ncbi:hypothetical protein [Brevibacillus sp. AY1]|uniref:hypothetical protein n=1 Tax=Brevibacillus sp. AY1 TaxID=2807621 RepID=UPI0024554076|nr:hypothetical protein [Brevibacillus sp. AY1]MDH4616003.1 hypothetical protein [Brevibacillus sp. AY1]